MTPQMYLIHRLDAVILILQILTALGFFASFLMLTGGITSLDSLYYSFGHGKARVYETRANRCFTYFKRTLVFTLLTGLLSLLVPTTQEMSKDKVVTTPLKISHPQTLSK